MFENLIGQTILQNRLLDYLVFLAIFLGGMLVVRLAKAVILKRLKVWANRTATTLDDYLVLTFERSLVPLFYFGAFYLAMRTLTLNPAFAEGLKVLGALVLTFYGVRFVVGAVTFLLQTYWLAQEADQARKNIIRGLLPAIKVVIWGVGIVFLLDNLGFEITAVVAGLGIGGIAVALAAQAVLGDLFSYFAIFFDRPFEIGDFIIVGDDLGTVEHVGIKTTRIRSLSGEQLVFSNTDLTNSRIRNYRKMQRRRVVFRLGVTYDTPLERLKEIPGIIERVINQVEDAKLDRAHFFEYGDFSLNYEVVYFVVGNNYNKYMDIQQEINLAINGEFQKRKIEFAYPTQTLYVAQVKP